jgi:hypothetical protein
LESFFFSGDEVYFSYIKHEWLEDFIARILKTTAVYCMKAVGMSRESDESMCIVKEIGYVVFK